MVRPRDIIPRALTATQTDTRQGRRQRQRHGPWFINSIVLVPSAFWSWSWRWRWRGTGRKDAMGKGKRKRKRKEGGMA